MPDKLGKNSIEIYASAYKKGYEDALEDCFETLKKVFTDMEAIAMTREELLELITAMKIK